MPKLTALLLCTLLSLSGCATGPNSGRNLGLNLGPMVDPVPPPALPAQVWAAPVRDWQGEMQSFLQGLLPTLPGWPANTGGALRPMTPQREPSAGAERAGAVVN